MREWCFVAEHMSLVDAMTSYSTSDKSKTIFEAVYGFVPDVDSLPPISFGGVILTGKNTHIVGNLQMAYDPLFVPFKEQKIIRHCFLIS